MWSLQVLTVLNEQFEEKLKREAKDEEFKKESEFCVYCGAGIGKFRRDGEGTCPKCTENEQGDSSEKEN